LKPGLPAGFLGHSGPPRPGLIVTLGPSCWTYGLWAPGGDHARAIAEGPSARAGPAWLGVERETRRLNRPPRGPASTAPGVGVCPTATAQRDGICWPWRGSYKLAPPSERRTIDATFSRGCLALAAALLLLAAPIGPTRQDTPSAVASSESPSARRPSLDPASSRYFQLFLTHSLREPRLQPGSLRFPQTDRSRSHPADLPSIPSRSPPDLAEKVDREQGRQGSTTFHPAKGAVPLSSNNKPPVNGPRGSFAEDVKYSLEPLHGRKSGFNNPAFEPVSAIECDRPSQPCRITLKRTLRAVPQPPSPIPIVSA